MKKKRCHFTTAEMTKADMMCEHGRRAPFLDIGVKEGDRKQAWGNGQRAWVGVLPAGVLGDRRPIHPLTEKGQQGTGQREGTKSQAGKTWRGRVASRTALASREMRGPASARSGWPTAVGVRDGVNRICHMETQSLEKHITKCLCHP